MWVTIIVLQVPRDSPNPTKKGLISRVDHVVLSYDMIILLQHIYYIYTASMLTLSNDKL
jgi:hypothetical protein